MSDATNRTLIVYGSTIVSSIYLVSEELFGIHPRADNRLTLVYILYNIFFLHPFFENRSIMGVHIRLLHNAPQRKESTYLLAYVRQFSVELQAMEEQNHNNAFRVGIQKCNGCYGSVGRLKKSRQKRKRGKKKGNKEEMIVMKRN